MGKMTQQVKDRIDEVIESKSDGAGGPVNLTQDDIQNLLGTWDSFFADQYTEGTPEYVAAQEQARAELVRMGEENPALNFSKEAFAGAVGLSGPDAINQYYNYDFTGKNDLGLSYGTTITTAMENYDPNSVAAVAAQNQSSVFGDTLDTVKGGGWTPADVTMDQVRAATNYDTLNPTYQAAINQYLPPAAKNLTTITQNTPAFTVADKLPATLFDAINFPERAITRGTPVVTRGLDQFGNPTTAITMGQSTATPTGENIGQLDTTTMFPSTGMGINADGTGTAKVGTLDSTGNIIATGADTINLFESGDTVTSTVDPNAVVTGKSTLSGPGCTGGKVKNTDGNCVCPEGKTENESGQCVTPVNTTTTTILDTQPTITCFNDAGQSQVFKGTTCPAAFPYTTKPAVGTTTITCYNANNESKDITGLNPVCPDAFSFTAPCPEGQTRDATGNCTTVTLNLCPQGSKLEGQAVPADGNCNPVESVSNIQAVANVVAKTNAALIAKYGPNPTQAQKDEFMDLGKQALVDLAMTTEGGFSVTDMALGAQISGATTLLDLDATAGVGGVGIDASAQDVFDVITDQYSGDGFGTVGDTTIFTDDFTSSPNAQLQSTISETDYSGVGTTGATTGTGTTLGTGTTTGTTLGTGTTTGTTLGTGATTGTTLGTGATTGTGTTTVTTPLVTTATTPTAADLLAARAAQTQSGTLSPLTVTEERVKDLIGKINSGALTVEQIATAYGVTPAAINAELAGRAGATVTTPTVTTPTVTTVTPTICPSGSKLAGQAIPADGNCNPADTVTTATTPTVADAIGATKTLIPGPGDTFIPYNTSPLPSAGAFNVNAGTIGDAAYGWGSGAQGLVEGDDSLYGFAEGGPTNPVEQRDAAVGSRLLRQAGIGSMQDKTMSPEMAGTLDRIMARRR